MLNLGVPAPFGVEDVSCEGQVLQVPVYHGQGRPDVDAVLEALESTRCLMDFQLLESVVQVVLQCFGKRKVWTVDIKECEQLQPQDLGRWVWTPVTCIFDKANEEFTKELMPWLVTGLERSTRSVE